MTPLEGLLVVDFSTLLPGPLASLMLTDAGARVVKIEHPRGGDEMRSYEPKLGEDSVSFAMLNRGKHSIAIDLKEPNAVNRLEPLLERADVLLEQFRPGVMDHSGLATRLCGESILASFTARSQDMDSMVPRLNEPAMTSTIWRRQEFFR